jgi:hypothetical protein
MTAIGQRILLGDHPAHGDAEQVEPGDAEVVDQALGVLGQHRTGVGAGRLAGLTDAAVVEQQQLIPGRGEGLLLERHVSRSSARPLMQTMVCSPWPASR